MSICPSVYPVYYCMYVCAMPPVSALASAGERPGCRPSRYTDTPSSATLPFALRELVEDLFSQGGSISTSPCMQLNPGATLAVTLFFFSRPRRSILARCSRAAVIPLHPPPRPRPPRVPVSHLQMHSYPLCLRPCATTCTCRTPRPSAEVCPNCSSSCSTALSSPQ